MGLSLLVDHSRLRWRGRNLSRWQTLLSLFVSQLTLHQWPPEQNFIKIAVHLAGMIQIYNRHWAAHMPLMPKPWRFHLRQAYVKWDHFAQSVSSAYSVRTRVFPYQKMHGLVERPYLTSLLTHRKIYYCRRLPSRLILVTRQIGRCFAP